MTSAGVRRTRWQLRLRNARRFAHRYAKRRDGVVGAAILLVFAVLAIAPALFVGPLETITTASGAPLEPPSLEHLLGTDEVGRDMLNLTVHGARISMVIGLLATLMTVLIGAVIGIVSGFSGGRTDQFLMRLTDLFVIVVVIGLTSWAATARIIRSQTLSVRERMFVDRARVIGGGRLHIMKSHILPNVVNLLVANTVLTFAAAIFTETTLAFIGLGDPFSPSWGQILNRAQESGAPGLGAWWYIAPPAFCVVVVILAFTLVGNALDDVLNPKAGLQR